MHAAPHVGRQMDSDSSGESSSGPLSLSSSVGSPHQGEDEAVIFVSLRPREFHLPRIARLIRRAHRNRAQVLLDRPLPLLVLFLGSAPVGGRLLLYTTVAEWRELSITCGEARLCIAHFALLTA